MKLLKLPKFHWAKLLSVFFFVLLLGAYASTFAIGQKYTPGATLDPACPPGEENCTVDIGGGSTDILGTYIVQTATNAPANAQLLSALTTGIVKNTTTTGVLSIAVNSDLPVMSATVSGAVPTPPNNTTTFLRGDGTFATPTGGGTPAGSTSQIQFNNNGIFGASSDLTWIPGSTGTSFSIGPDVTFTKADHETASVDEISSFVTLKRDDTKGLYNATSESFYDKNNYLSPLGTEWNSLGWGDLTNVDARTYVSFYEALGQHVGNNIIGSELVMHDIGADKYYKFDFTAWTSDGYGGFSYIRNLITLSTSVSSLLTASGNILIGGENRYLNFGTTNGFLGYGFRDANGTLNYKNSSGAWTAFGLISDADFNTKGGTDAGLNLVSGAQNNTFLGYEAGKGGVVTNAADNNTGIGYQSLYSNTGGWDNTANGSYSLYSNTTGFRNTANGSYSLRFNTTGSLNTANGSYSLSSNTTGSSNTANGFESLFSNTTGYYNTANGYYSLVSNTTGTNNTANGFQSLNSNTTGSENTANGSNSLYYNTTGSENTANGMQSLQSNTTGYENTANGFESLYSNTTGYYNTANGGYSLYFNTTGFNNTANGYKSLTFNYTGSNNTAFGFQSGQWAGSGSTQNQTSNNSLYLGYDTRASADGNTNEIVIGYGTIGNGSDTTTIGNTSTLRTYLTGLNLKAGTATAGTAPLKFTSSAGALLSPTEAGAVEYDGSHLYFTATASGTRFQLDQQGLSSDTDFNTKGGTSAGLNLVAGAQNNTFIGYEAGKSGAGTTNNADNNTAIGYQSLFSNTTGYSNTANGSYSLYSNITGSWNTANGNGSLYSNTTGFRNTANGYFSLSSNTTGSENTANGNESLRSNTDGNENTANGNQSLYSNTTGYNNTANGYQSLYSNTTGYQNTANGNYSLSSNTTGSDNTANGFQSLFSNTTGNSNTANGSYSLFTNKANNRSTAIGYNSMYYADDRTSGRSTYNTAIGYEALKGSATAANNTGQYNTAIGDSALFSNTTGYDNTANGYQSLYSNTTGLYNTANGYRSLYRNTTGSYNSANGNGSLYSNTTGYYNTANGNDSLSLNTTGSWNTANGYASLYANTTGFNNTANGIYSLSSNTTGNDNTANGYQSLYSNTIGNQNTANGNYSLYSNTTGNNNTANGMSALQSNTTGSNNTALGYQSGVYAGSGSTPNQTSNNSLYLGYDTRPSANGNTNEIVIGYTTIGNGSNTTTLGTGNVLYVGGTGITGMVARFTNSAGYCDINPLTTALVCTSDINLKKNITTLNGEDFILNTEIDSKDKGTLEKIISLNPVTYNWNTEEDSTGKHIGFIAQEMEQVFPDLVFTDSVTGLKSVAFTNLIPYTVEAIKEMNLKVKDLSSLDTESATSLGSLIKDFLGSVGNNISDLYASVIHSDKVETKILCVGSTCVTEDQFLEIVNKNVTTDDATKEYIDDGSAIIPITPPLDTAETTVEDKKEEEQPVIEKKTEETPTENPAPLVESTSENTD